MKALSILCFILLSSQMASGQCVLSFNKIEAPDRNPNDQFGRSVSVSGNYAIVGAMAQDYDGNGINFVADAGAAYIYERDASGNWSFSQKIVASDRSVGDNFGYSVSISGKYAVVGAYLEDEDENGLNTIINAGSAYFFKRINGTWTEIQKVVSSSRGSSELFGIDVDIAGNYAIVGSRDRDDASGLNPLSEAGSADIFELVSNSWLHTARLTASDRDAGDLFGHSVAISDDYAIVGAYSEDEDENGGNYKNSAGSAYIFSRQGSSWLQYQKINHSLRDSFDSFGYSVAIEDTVLVVGAWTRTNNSTGGSPALNAGAAYVFELNSSAQWIETDALFATDRSASALFGSSVSISNNAIVIGAFNDGFDNNGSNALAQAGSAYLFKKINNNWSQSQKIIAPDRQAVDWFGETVSIENGKIIIGAKYEDKAGTNTQNNSGAAYVYEDSCIITCNKPNNLLSVPSYRTAQLSWAPVNGANSYIIEGGVQGSGYIRIPFSGTNLSATGLSEATPYEWHVRAVCGGGDTSDYSEFDFFSTLSCDPPTSLNETNLTTNSVTLNWSQVPGILGYRLVGGQGGSIQASFDIPGSSNNSFNASGLGSGITYQWAVYSICKVSPFIISDISAVSSFTTLNHQQKRETNEELYIFPNPGNGIFRLHSANNEESLISVANLEGKVVEEFILNQSVTVDLSHLESDIYFLRLMKDKIVKLSEKLVIVK